MATTSQDDDPSDEQERAQDGQERSTSLRGSHEERDDSVRRKREEGEPAAPSVPVFVQLTDQHASTHASSQASSSSSTLPSSVPAGSQPSKPIRIHKRPLDQLEWVAVPEKRSRKTVEYTGHTPLPNLLAPLLASLPSQYQPLLENLTADLQLRPLPSLPSLRSMEIQLILDRCIQSKPLAADLSKTEFGDLLSWKERGRFADVASKLTSRIRYLKTALEDTKLGTRSAEGTNEKGKGKGKQRESAAGSTTKDSEGDEAERRGREASSDMSSLPSPNIGEVGAASSSSRRSGGSPRPSPSNRTNEEPAPSPIEPSSSTSRRPHSYVAPYSASPVSSFPRLSGEDPSSVELVHPQPQSRRSVDLESSVSTDAAHSQSSQSNHSPPFPPPSHSSTSASHRTGQPRPLSDPNPSTLRDHPNPVAPFLQNPYLALRPGVHGGPSPPTPTRPLPPPFINSPRSPLPPQNHQSHQAPYHPPPQPRTPNPLDPNAHRQLPSHYSTYSPSNQKFPPHQPYPPQPQYIQQPSDDPRGQTSDFGRPPPRRPSLTFKSSRPTTSSSSSGSPSTTKPVYKEPYLPGPSRARSTWSSDQGGSNRYASPSSSRSVASSYPPPPPPSNFQRPREPPSSFPPPPPPPPRLGRGKTISGEEGWTEGVTKSDACIF